MRKALTAALVAVVAAGAFAPAAAAPPKKKPPMTGSFSAQNVPFPLTGSGPTDTASSCINPMFEGIAITSQTIKSTGAGTLVVEMTNFYGDWDISILNSAGEQVAAGDNASAAGTAMSTGEIVEKAVVKYKKASEIKISVCNFAGGPTADVKYTYTYK